MSPGLTSKEFSLMQKFIEEKCGIAIGEEKAYLIESRLTKLLIDSGLSNFEELYQKICLNCNPSITEKVIDSITTNETLWFRDKSPWNILEDILLPVYIQELRDRKRSSVRIWSAACSTGQEAYSTAICIDNYLFKHGITDVRLSDFEILATDISNTVLHIGRMGKFDSISIMRGLDANYKEKYFTNEGRIWCLNEKIKSIVRFQQFNLQNSFLLLGKFDLLFCRYVIIYFSDALKKQILSRMANAINPQGVFMVGSSEIFTNYQERYEMREYKNGVYYRIKE
jgi:chemotaxis protein methyltransferase CheR